jgi:hypothetical protein
VVGDELQVLEVDGLALGEFDTEKVDVVGEDDGFQ